MTSQVSPVTQVTQVTPVFKRPVLRSLPIKQFKQSQVFINTQHLGKKRKVEKITPAALASKSKAEEEGCSASTSPLEKKRKVEEITPPAPAPAPAPAPTPAKSKAEEEVLSAACEATMDALDDTGLYVRIVETIVAYFISGSGELNKEEQNIYRAMRADLARVCRVSEDKVDFALVKKHLATEKLYNMSTRAEAVALEGKEEVFLARRRGGGIVKVDITTTFN